MINFESLKKELYGEYGKKLCEQHHLKDHDRRTLLKIIIINAFQLQGLDNRPLATRNIRVSEGKGGIDFKSSLRLRFEENAIACITKIKSLMTDEYIGIETASEYEILKYTIFWRKTIELFNEHVTANLTVDHIENEIFEETWNEVTTSKAAAVKAADISLNLNDLSQLTSEQWTELFTIVKASDTTSLVLNKSTEQHLNGEKLEEVWNEELETAWNETVAQTADQTPSKETFPATKDSELEESELEKIWSETNRKSHAIPGIKMSKFTLFQPGEARTETTSTEISAEVPEDLRKQIQNSGGTSQTYKPVNHLNARHDINKLTELSGKIKIMQANREGRLRCRL